jgi:hypothetical protein
MVRTRLVAAAVFLCSLPFPARAANAESGGGRPRLVTGAVGVGTYLFLVHEVSAEALVADRVAIGARAVYFPGPGAELHVLPSVTLGSARSRPSAGYVTLAWVPGSSGKAFAGTLGLGYERAFPNRIRVYGEAGVFAGASDEFALAAPYLFVGVRLRL